MCKMTQCGEKQHCWSPILFFFFVKKGNKLVVTEQKNTTIRATNVGQWENGNRSDNIDKANPFFCCRTTRLFFQTSFFFSKENYSWMPCYNKNRLWKDQQTTAKQCVVLLEKKLSISMTLLLFKFLKKMVVVVWLFSTVWIFFRKKERENYDRLDE